MAIPSVPDGVCVVSTVNALSLRINWNTVDGVSTYSLYRSAVPHDEFLQVATGISGLTTFDNPQSSLLSTNLRNLWYYQVSAVNLDGEGPQSPPSTYRPYGQLVDTNVPRTGLSHWNLISG